jgi:predicted metal-binding membrane protein
MNGTQRAETPAGAAMGAGRAAGGRGNASNGRFYLWSAVAFALSLGATVWFCLDMSGGMAMPGGWTMSMMWMRMPGQSWPSAAGMFVAMWAVMMVAMMLPSAMPMLLGYRPPDGARASHGGSPALGVAAGYFTVWTLAGVAVYLPGVLWAQATMSSAGLSKAVPWLMATALLAAGTIQFMPWKLARLRQCRDVTGCNQGSKRGGEPFGYGIREGISCAVCCSGHMIALLALGGMDPLVMIIVGAVIAAEKLLPHPERTSRIAGIAAIVAGVVITVRGLS